MFEDCTGAGFFTAFFLAAGFFILQAINFPEKKFPTRIFDNIAEPKQNTKNQTSR
jgi:hypothetical protein